MSIRDTCPSVVKLSEKYEGLQNSLLDETVVLNITRSLEDDIALRRFFISGTFSDYFKRNRKKNELYEFVISTHTFPAIVADRVGYKLLDYFISMRRDAADVFSKNLDRRFNDVCEKAEEIGLFKTQLYLVDAKSAGFNLVSVEAYSETNSNLYGTFYTISDSLFEYWIKPENKGKMLEVWVHGILKQHFGMYPSITICNCLDIRSRKDITYRDAEALVSDPHELDLTLTDIDCVIMQADDVIVLVECKTGKTGPSDVLKLYGLIKLLNAHFGIFIISHDEDYKTDQEFECIKIYPNVANRDDFPKIFIDYLRSKLDTVI